MMTTNLKKLFDEAGLEAVRPTDEALVAMNISRRRFTLLWENDNKTPLTVPELEALKAWVEGIKSLDPEMIVGDGASSSELASQLGLTK